MNLSTQAARTQERAPPREQDLLFAIGGSLSCGTASLETVLLESPETPECISAATAIRLHALPVRVSCIPREELRQHEAALRAGRCLPIGSRGFMQLAIQLARIARPKWTGFPAGLGAYFTNLPRRTSAATALRMRGPLVVRPARAGSFEAFLLHDTMADEDLQQLEVLRTLPSDEPVEVGPALGAEWRFYVLDGEVVGYAPCPPWDADSACPDIEDVSAIVAAIPADAVYAIDVAVLRAGGSSLTRVHDPLHMEVLRAGPHRPTHLSFLCMLWRRWKELQQVTGHGTVDRTRLREPR